MPTLDDLLDAPFGSAADVVELAYNIPGTFGASLDGHPLVIDTKEYRRRTTPATRVGQDASAIPGEQALNNEVYWTRSQRNWKFGSGQYVFDSADSGVDNLISRQRAEEIWNLDIDNADGIFITDFIETPKTVAMSGGTAVTNRVIAASDTYTYWIDEDNNDVYMMDVTTGIITECTVHASFTPTQLTTNGVLVFVSNGFATASQLSWATVGGTTFTSYGGGLSQPGQSVFYAHGFLFAGHGPELSTVAASGARTAHFTQAFNGYWGTNGWASSPEFVYVVWKSLTNGRTTVYKMTTDSDGLLTLPTVALPEMQGEVIQCLHWHEGIMLIGTNYGFRAAAIDNGNLTPGPLIEVNRDRFATNFGIKQFAVFDGKVWFPLYAIYNDRNNNVPTELTEGDVSGVGVIDLGFAVDTLQPAWREVWRGAGSVIPTAVVGTATRLLWFSNTSAYILKHDALNTHPTLAGTFSTGWITFGIDAKKTFIDVDISHDPLTTGQQVSVYLQEEDVDDPVLLGMSTTVGSTAPPGAYPVGNISSNRIRLIFVLEGDVESPHYKPTRLRRWMLRAYPQPKRVDEIIVPHMLSADVLTGVDEAGQFHYDVLAEWQHFTELAASGEIVFYQEGAEVYRVKVDSLEVQPSGWTTGEDGAHYFYNSRLMIRLLTLD